MVLVKRVDDVPAKRSRFRRVMLYRAPRLPLNGKIEAVDIPLLPDDTVLSVEIVPGKIPCVRIRLNHP